MASDKLFGMVRSAWRTDLPTLAPDGAIATVRGDDLTLVDPSPSARRGAQRGAKDVWLFAAWNGFRPRAKELDEPVTFQEPGTPPDSAARTAAAPSARGGDPWPEGRHPVQPSLTLAGVRFACLHRAVRCPAATREGRRKRPPKGWRPAGSLPAW